MPSSAAYEPARPLALLTARTSPHPDRRMPGMTCSRAMRAAPSTPQRSDVTRTPSVECRPAPVVAPAGDGRHAVSPGPSPSLIMTLVTPGLDRAPAHPRREDRTPWAE